MIGIKGTGIYLPETRYSNFDRMEQFGEDLTLSLVGPEEWNELCPYGMLIAKVRQLGDSTWEVVENDGC